MAPINLHGPLKGTHSLKGADSLNRLGSICMKPIHYSLSTTSPYEWYSLFNGFTDSEEEAFFICSHIFGANSLAKNVSEKQHVCFACRHSANQNAHASMQRVAASF